MELKFALLLGIISLASTTPHGYVGVKTGAIAKAEAGAFAGVPEIALGGAGASAVSGVGSAKFGGVGNGAHGGSFTSSGSFSKASASSFASSSSSSYSYSGSGTGTGTGTGTFSAPILGQGTVNNMPGHLSSSESDNHGIFNNGASGSSSGLVFNNPGSPSTGSIPSNYQSNSNSGAALYPGSTFNQGEYTSTSDAINNDKCGTPGNCGNKPLNSGSVIKAGAINFNSAQSAAVAGSNAFTGSKCTSSKCDDSISKNKCTSADCQTKPHSEEPQQNGNDIPVNIPGYSSTKTSYDADEQSKNVYSTNPYNPNCANNNCGGTNSNPGATVPVEVNNQILPNGNPTGNQQCTTPNCNNYSHSPDPGFSKDNYNKAAPSTYLTPPKEIDSKTVECTSGNCQDSSNVNSFTSSGNGVPIFSHTRYPSYNPSASNPCTSGNCGTVQESASKPCTTGNCGNNQGATIKPCIAGNCLNINQNANSNAVSNSGASSHSASQHTTSTNFNPLESKCNGQFCKPSLAPNYSTGTIPSSGKPGFANSGNCNSPNCGNNPSTQISTGVSASTVSFDNTKPNYDSHGKAPNHQPIYTGGFGGPSGILKPKDYSASSKPSFSQPNKPTIPSFQPSTSGIVTNTPLNNKPNSEDIPNFVALQPNNQETNCNGQSCKPSSTPSHSTGTSPSSGTSGFTSSGNCNSPNCGSYPPNQINTGISASAVSFGNTKPNYDTHSKTPSYQPTYTGAFGGPSGILKPDDYSVPSKPSFSQPNKPSNIPNFQPSTSGIVTNGPPNNKPNSENVPNFVGLQPNNPDTINNNYGHTQIATSASALAGASAAVYTGGFGGPPGFLKPYDNGVKSSTYSHSLEKTGAGTEAIPNNNFGRPQTGHHYSGVQSGSSSLSGAFAGAGAIAGAGAFGGSSTGYSKQPVHEYTYNDGPNNGKGGCIHGCQSGGDKVYNAGSGFGLSGTLGLSKTGIFDGLADGGLNAASAAAKGIAGAIGTAGADARSFGLSGSFAGSAASAHASSGAVAKGGYGRR